jgi:diketogulonate reductase-like aldo/keto reductase
VLSDGTSVPALGQGTFRLGESARWRRRDAAAIAAGIALGMTLIDTAEMYGDGGAEAAVGDAIAPARDRVFVVSKVYPHNAGATSAIAACERSLSRLRTDRLDLYLLHWRGRIPLAETIDAFERLRQDGKILRWGVSNFDVADMVELLALPQGQQCAVNQVLWHLGERGVEWALEGVCRRHGIALMAYCPLGEGQLLHDGRLRSIATTQHLTPAQLALAWLIHRGAIAIPKSGRLAHLRQNRMAADVTLSATVLAAIDTAFAPPTWATPLAMV